MREARDMGVPGVSTVDPDPDARLVVDLATPGSVYVVTADLAGVPELSCLRISRP